VPVVEEWNASEDHQQAQRRTFDCGVAGVAGVRNRRFARYHLGRYDYPEIHDQ